MRIRQTQPRNPRRRRTAQGESRRAGRGGAAMSGDGQHLEAWKKAGECRDFPQPWSDYLWSLEFDHRPSDAKAFIRRLLGSTFFLVENILPKKRSSLTAPTTQRRNPPTRTAIAPNLLTFYFLQIRTAGSFDKEPAIILLSAATNAVCGADIGIIYFGDHERFILRDSPPARPYCLSASSEASRPSSCSTMWACMFSSILTVRRKTTRLATIPASGR